jgi:hypothetical protein
VLRCENRGWSWAEVRARILRIHQISAYDDFNLETGHQHLKTTFLWGSFTRHFSPTIFVLFLCKLIAEF